MTDIEDLQRQMAMLTEDVRELRRQKPAPLAPLVYGFAAIAALWAAKVGLDNGRVWEILLALAFFTGWILKALTAWQDRIDYKARRP